MSLAYEMIGRGVMWFVRVRFRRQIRIATVAGVVILAIAGYLAAARSVDEG